MFELEVVVESKKYYRYFWENWLEKNHVSFNYPFGGDQTGYRIRVAMID